MTTQCAIVRCCDQTDAAWPDLGRFSINLWLLSQYPSSAGFKQHMNPTDRQAYLGGPGISSQSCENTSGSDGS